MATPAGLAHVATVSFLAARVAPTGSFWLSLAGGAALAREADMRGARSGYAGSAAAMLQTVAMVGPLRINAPLTQALSAPLLGAMHARGRRPLTQFVACLAIRLLHYTALSAFALFVLIGTKGYAGSYNRLFGWLPFLPAGLAGAIVLTAIGNLVFAVFFSAVQTAFYRHALAGWSERAGQQPPAPPGPTSGASVAETQGVPGVDARVALLAATLVTIVLLASHRWEVLAAVGAWLAGASLLARGGDRDVLRVGLLLTLTLALGTLIASLVGGLGADEAASRAVRSALLVLVATWLRLAAGSAGLREAFRRTLLRFRRVPAAGEAGLILGELDSGALLVSSGTALRDRLRDVPHRPLPVATAVLAWAAAEAQSVPAEHSRSASGELRVRPRDAVLGASLLLLGGALAAVIGR